MSTSAFPARMTTSTITAPVIIMPKATHATLREKSRALSGMVQAK